MTQELTLDMLPDWMQPFALDKVLKCKDCRYYPDPDGTGPIWLRCGLDDRQIHYDAVACDHIEELAV